MVIAVVLISSFVVVGVVFKVIPRIKAQLTGMPQGKIVAEPKSAAATGSIKFTAEDVVGVSNAQIDYVRYYLLNPSLAPGNTWGNPNWCSGQEPCTQTTAAPFITYDFGESSNPNNNYEIVWNSSTYSSGSTPYSRALTPQNIPPGTYTVGLRVEDVEGNVNGGASQTTVIITDGTLPTGGYKVTYKNNVTGATVVENINSSVIKFNPGLSEPKPGIGTGSYTVTWEGFQNFPGGFMRFNTQMLGGSVKVFVDGSLAHETAIAGSQQGIKSVDVGNHLVKVEYTHISGSARNIYNHVHAYNCSDMTADNYVNSGDMAVISKYQGRTGTTPWDVTADSKVDQKDLDKAATQFNKTCS